jgi:serine/threonine-protein kinase
MATDFHVRVQRVLERAARAAPGAREEVLRRACAGSPALLREALSLLPHYLAAGGFEPPRPGGWLRCLPGTTTLGRIRTEADDAEVAEDEPQPPFTLEQYTVVQVLGRGGMGVVYKAVQPVVGRAVAIKLLRRRLGSDADRRRFALEGEVLRQLRHPGIARFSHSGVTRLPPRRPGAGECEERPYFVMEYVAGEPLTRFAAARQLDTRQRLALLIRICEAAEYAHDRGIVHCDLKPDNILVKESGAPKILDFGVARLLAFEATPTDGARAITGTLPYASPEQLQGRVEQIAPATDVYALGLTAYELFTGSRPRRQGWRVPVELPDVCIEPGWPLEHACNAQFRFYLQRILTTALRQTSGRAYSSAGKLGADLERLLARFGRRLRGGLRARPADKRDGAGDASPLRRALSAVLRKRISMALDPKAHPAAGTPAEPNSSAPEAARGEDFIRGDRQRE